MAYNNQCCRNYCPLGLFRETELRFNTTGSDCPHAYRVSGWTFVPGHRPELSYVKTQKFHYTFCSRWGCIIDSDIPSAFGIYPSEYILFQCWYPSHFRFENSQENDWDSHSQITQWNSSQSQDSQTLT
jgi:hypothetical protein